MTAQAFFTLFSTVQIKVGKSVYTHLKKKEKNRRYPATIERITNKLYDHIKLFIEYTYHLAHVFTYVIF